MPVEEKESRAATITGIEVRNLFGYLSYNIGTKKSRNPADALILYGDNGSGKTSMLRLLFYLLSPADKRGHKTEVAQTVFSRFSVYFNTGISINTTRPARETVGEFAMTICSGSTVLHQYVFKPTRPDGSIQISEPDELKKVMAFFEELGKLGITLFFLKDDRSIETTLFDDRRDEDEVILHELREQRLEPAALTIKAARTAVRRAAMFVRTGAFRASNLGDTNTYNVYLEIIRRIAAAAHDEGARPSTSVKGLLKQLRVISRRAERLSSLGLITPVDVREMTVLLRRMRGSRATIAEQVVLPYVNSTTARFDALERIAIPLEKFLSYLNKFYKDKKISFDLHDGFTIRSDAAGPLTPDMLSSGERHLLLLFCNVLVAQDRASLFIIDEPELSLNVRWQRLLIKALVDFVEGTHVRFVFATHSIEMLTQHLTNVHKLKALRTRSTERP